MDCQSTYSSSGERTPIVWTCEQAKLELVRLRVAEHIKNGPARELKALNKARWIEIEARTRMDYIALHG